MLGLTKRAVLRRFVGHSNQWIATVLYRLAAAVNPISSPEPLQLLGWESQFYLKNYFGFAHRPPVTSEGNNFPLCSPGLPEKW
jgi:hypothetical protein